MGKSLNVLEVELFDLGSGARVCSKQLQDSLSYSRSAHVALVNNSLQLCGGLHADDRDSVYSKCRKADMLDGDFDELPGNGLPVYGGASHSAGAKWLIVGGNLPSSPDPIRLSTIYEHLDADGTFLGGALSTVYPPLDWNAGRGCLVRFAGPGDHEVTVYFSSDTDQAAGLHGFVHYEGSPALTPPRTFFVADATLHPSPICGHAVDANGDSHVFYATEEEEVAGHAIVVPTSSEALMTAFQDSGAPDIVPESIPAVQGAIISSKEPGKAAWIGEQRMVVVFAKSSPIVFDADKKVVEPFVNLESISDGEKIFLQRVEEKDPILCQEDD